jgi:hypothetical protein
VKNAKGETGRIRNGILQKPNKEMYETEGKEK